MTHFAKDDSLWLPKYYESNENLFKLSEYLSSEHLVDRMFRYQHQFYGTIKPKINFDPEQAAEILHKAMKGIGCDKEKVLQILTTINNEQRQEQK
uniref:Uncharacterized protein n=1 Tax=Onchocerca volvulus TaxID=6282 RepID=A0A8R1XQ03_ONCVO